MCKRVVNMCKQGKEKRCGVKIARETTERWPGNGLVQYSK